MICLLRGSLCYVARIESERSTKRPLQLKHPSGRCGGKYSYLGCVLKVELTGFADGLNVELREIEE